MFKSNEIGQRLSNRVSLKEFAAIVFVLTLSLTFIFRKTGNFGDYHIYLATANNDFENYFYGYWLLPFFQLLNMLPFEIGYVIWIILSILGVWFAARVFNGNGALALISYQMSYVLAIGQISGIICGMLGLFWWAIHKQKWEFAGLAFLIAAAKPQSGGVIVLLLLVFSDIAWRKKIRVLLIPVFGFLLSMVMYPGWVFDIISRKSLISITGNISLSQWISSFSLLVFLPIIFLRPEKKEKLFFILVSACVLASPYYAHPDLLTIFIFPVHFIAILLGYLPAIMVLLISFAGQPSGVVVPVFIYLWNIIPEIIEYFKNTFIHKYLFNK